MRSRFERAIPFLSLQPFLAPDNGTGNGGATATEPKSDGDTPAGEQGGNDSGDDSDESHDVDDASAEDDTPPAGRSFTQEDVDRIVQERLERERQKQEKAADKARREAEEQAAKDQGKWQELAESHAKRISELESLEPQLEETQATADRYKGALERHLEVQRSELPGHITALLDQLDPVAQLEWISEHRETITASQNGNQTKKGVPPAPKPGDDRMTDEDKRRVAYRPRL